MYRSIVLFFLFSITISGYSQSKNIVECLELIDFNPEQYIVADIPLDRTDSIVDIKAGYFEISISQFEDEKLILLQAVTFNNSDGSITVGITGFSEDGICTHFPFQFYEIPKNGMRYRKLVDKAIFPSLSIKFLLKESDVIPVLKKCLPKLQNDYKDPGLTIEDLINEVFSIHVIQPFNGTDAILTLSICDYDIEISPEDWKILKDSVKKVTYGYDPTEKQFVPLLKNGPE